MTTPQWFKNSNESKETIHDRLTQLESSTRKHLCILRHNQYILESALKNIHHRKVSQFPSDTYVVSKVPLNKKKLLEKTFHDSNQAILKIVVETAIKKNPAIIPWIHQQINRYMQVPYIPSIKTQLTNLEQIQNPSRNMYEPSDDESM